MKDYCLDKKTYSTISSFLRRCGFHKNGEFKDTYTHGPLAKYLCYLFYKKQGVVSNSDIFVFKLGNNQSFNLMVLLRKIGVVTWTGDIKNKEKFVVKPYGRLSFILERNGYYDKN